MIYRLQKNGKHLREFAYVTLVLVVLTIILAINFLVQFDAS